MILQNLRISIIMCSVQPQLDSIDKPRKGLAKYKRTTTRSNRDFEEVTIRTNTLGPRVHLVTEILKSIYGENVTAVWLLHLARKIEDILRLPLDRLARRNRQALFCWFAENWTTIHPFLKSISMGDSNPKIDDAKFYDIRLLLNYH